MRTRSLATVFASAMIFASLVFSSSCSGEAGQLEEAFSGFKGKYAVLVNKKEFTLKVYDRQKRVIAAYRIAYGLNPDRMAKVHAGDNRTPEGLYHVTEMLSMDADKSSDAYRKLRSLNSVYFRAADGHYRFGFPKVDLGDNAYGPRFFLLNYPTPGDLERYGEAVRKGTVATMHGNKLPGPGSGIAIHGNCDETSIGRLSSSGCIRMFNSDIVELEQYVIIGTPVIIRGE